MGQAVRIRSAANVIEIDDIGFVSPHAEPGVDLLPPPAGTPDGRVLTAKVSALGGMDWEAAAGGAPTGTAGGDLAGTYPNPTVPGLLLKSVTITLTNSDILNILGTPKTLITPSAGTAILPIAGYAIHDFSHGVYIDPDATGDINILDGVTGGRWGIITPISDADNQIQYGATKFFTYAPVITGQSGWLSYLNNISNTPVANGTGALILKKSGITGEYSGGGSGNTLKITLYYIAVPTT